MMNIKALFYFFLLMSILNLPIMLLYYKGNTEEVEITQGNSRLLAEASGDDQNEGFFTMVNHFLFSVSVGHLGSLAPAC